MTNMMRAQIEQLAIVLHMQMADERMRVQARQAGVDYQPSAPPAWSSLSQIDRDYCRMKAMQMLDEPLPAKVEL